MQGIIRIGDKTTGGGTVLTGSKYMKFGGIGAARQGDAVDCPKPGHGRTTITEGNPRFRDGGVPVAFDGHACACGCTLISSLPQARAQ
jgi:uncharacterized Zn-binding protein involved in type VI secretion